MNRYFYTSVLALALVTAYAVSQTGSYPSSNPPSSHPQSGTTMPDASQSTSPSSNNPSSKGQSNTDLSLPQSDQTKTATVDDQTLHTKVHEQLSTNPALSNVNVTVNDGVVTLEGSVATKLDRKEAKKIAESVPGVKKVKDKLKVETSSATAGSTSGTMPSGSTSSSSNGTSSTTSSEPTTTSSGNTQAGTSSAAGTTPPAGSASQESNASGSAQSQTSSQTSSLTGSSAKTQTSGQVGAGTSTGMPQGDVNAAATDNSTLQDQIRTAIKNEPTLANDAIVVVVTDDGVDLSGTAASKKERQTARRIAQSYANNRKVTDHITVSGNNPENKNDTDRKNSSNQTPPDQSYPK